MIIFSINCSIVLSTKFQKKVKINIISKLVSSNSLFYPTISPKHKDICYTSINDTETQPILPFEKLERLDVSTECKSWGAELSNYRCKTQGYWQVWPKTDIFSLVLLEPWQRKTCLSFYKTKKAQTLQQIYVSFHNPSYLSWFPTPRWGSTAQPHFFHNTGHPQITSDTQMPLSLRDWDTLAPVILPLSVCVPAQPASMIPSLSHP